MNESRHSISLDQAKKMTAKYREEKKKVLKEDYGKSDILPISETFDRAAFDQLLAQPGCVSIRAYYGMDEENLVHLIVVGVNEKGEDMLPTESAAARSGSSTETTSYLLVENATRCPPTCPPPVTGGGL